MSNSIRLHIRIEDAENYLRQQLADGSRLLQIPIETDEQLQDVTEQYMRWHELNKQLLKKMFAKSMPLEEYVSADSSNFVFYSSIKRQVQALHKDIQDSMARLTDIRSQLATFEPPRREEPQPERVAAPQATNKFFLVAGTDQDLMLESLKFEQAGPVQLIPANEHCSKLLERIDGHPHVRRAVVFWDISPMDETESLANIAALSMLTGYLLAQLGWENVLFAGSPPAAVTQTGRASILDPEEDAEAQIKAFVAPPTSADEQGVPQESDETGKVTT